MNYMINLKSLGLLLAWFTLSPLAQAAPGSESEDRSNSNSAAENVNEVPAQAVTVDPLTVNPLQVALLKWGTYSGVKFLVGSARRLAFDGANIWAANRGLDTLTELRASDGGLVRTIPLGGQTQPQALAFDGANIWAAGAFGKVFKVRATNGEVLGSFNIGGDPQGIAFDGANIWITSSRSVRKLRASNGELLGDFTPGVGVGGVAFDGANIWVACFGSNWVSKL